MERYLRCSREAAAAASRCQAGEAQIPSVRTELALTCMRRCVEARVAEEEYKESVMRLNSASQTHRKKLSVILQSLQDMEEKRMLCFRDALRKVAVYQAAFLRNLQYELDQTIKQVEAIDPQADIQEFLGKYQAPPRTSSEVTIKPQSWTDLERTFGDCLLGSATGPTKKGTDAPAVSSTLLGSSAAATASSVARSILQKTPFTRVMQSAASFVGAGNSESHASAFSSIGGNPGYNSSGVTTTGASAVAGGGQGNPRGASVLGGRAFGGGSRGSKAQSFGREMEGLQDDVVVEAGQGGLLPGEEAAVKKLEKEYEEILDLLWERDDRSLLETSAEENDDDKREKAGSEKGGSVVVDPAQCPYSADTCERLSSILPQLKNDFSSSLKRFAFLKTLERRRRHSMVKGHRQVYLQHMLSLRVLGEISEWLLDYADEQLDVWTGRLLLLLSMQIAASGAKSADPQLQSFSWEVFRSRQKDVEEKNNSEETEKKEAPHPSADEETVRWSLHVSLKRPMCIGPIARDSAGENPPRSAGLLCLRIGECQSSSKSCRARRTVREGAWASICRTPGTSYRDAWW